MTLSKSEREILKKLCEHLKNAKRRLSASRSFFLARNFPQGEKALRGAMGCLNQAQQLTELLRGRKR